MASTREVVFLNDFRGGLNLTTNEQSLEQSETPDCLNVDFGARGGFKLRGGFRSQAQTTELSEDAYFLGATYFSSDVVLIDDGTGNLFSWDGTLTDESEVISDQSPDDRVRMAVFEDTAYFVNGYDTSVLKSRSWDGTTLTTLANAFNDTETPATGNMPLARHIAVYKNHVFVADTVESSVRYPHRIRFSYIGYPEDYRTADYIDIDPGDDGDPITGLMPFQNVLLIFKKSSVHALYGDDRSTFYRETISTESGVAGPDAITVNSGVGYWFSTTGYVMGWNGRGAVPVTDKIKWWTENGKIDNPSSGHVLRWIDDRLWLSLKASDSAVNRYTFVYDPALKAVTRYAEDWSSMIEWSRLDNDSDPLFLPGAKNGIGLQNLYRYSGAYNTDTIQSAPLHFYSGEVWHMYDGTTPVDPYATVPVNIDIIGYYRTAWITAGETATRKRWKRPRVTYGADGPLQAILEVFHDFNESDAARQFNTELGGAQSSVWGTLVWDTDVWGTENDEVYSFRRMPAGGSSYAIQFKFSTNSSTGRWWVDSIALPFRRKSIR